MFKELELHPVYTSDEDDIPRDFYNPVLKRAKTFDRNGHYIQEKRMY